MRQSILVILAILWLSPAGADDSVLHAVAYHDVRDRVARDFDSDQYAVSAENLVSHFSWLRANGYTPVSVDDILAARRGERDLPNKAVLLSFDDGLASVYTHVFPLLKVFGYPAVVSVVTGWIEADEVVDYGGRALGRDGFLTWAQVREMQESGLVEIASHTHDLHHGIEGNPQGNLQPAAVTRLFRDGGYEGEDAYRARISADFESSAAAIREHTGRAPRLMTWPYGAHNATVEELAARHGMTLTLTLEDQPNHPARPALARDLIVANPGVRDFSALFVRPPAPEVVRAAQIDLDYVFDDDPAQQERNLDRLLDRIKALEISHVFLQAFADPDGDGAADALYFPNEHLPVRADLFNRVSWQLKTRADVKVYAWLPMLSFVGGSFDPAWRVMESRDGIVGPDDAAEPRLSPYRPEVRARIGDIYRSLGIHADFDGLLFHDDGRLNEFEDANPAAIEAYRAALGDGFSIAKAREDVLLGERWADLKSRALLDLSDELTAIVREHRPGLKTARNLFASALLDPGSTSYLAQDFDQFLERYDHVALMAMPYLEEAGDRDGFYAALVDAVRARPAGLTRTIFELQTVDWRGRNPIPATEIRRTMRWLQAQGVRHLGYYPDDFIVDQPDFDELRQGISLAEHLQAEAL